jgi:DNA-binding LacI/PurR family transcriptional regulator
MANVSVATVSMVLNENPRISRATQLKVQRLIERTGYKPNRIAQSLSSKYTRVIAIMLPALRHAFADAYFGELISGICDRAGKLGHKVMLESAKPDFLKEKRHIELFERRYVDGVLLLGFNDRHTWLEDLADRGYPAISVNNYLPGLKLGHVTCDYRGGAEQMMNYLLQLGHRKIGMICGAMMTATQRDIIEVYRARLAERGVPVADDWIEDGRFTEEGGAAAAEALLSRHKDMTAILGGNDKMAMGAVYYMTRAGIRTPADVSITGFDDISHTAYVHPSLTTVHVPLYQLGALACERLIERVRGTGTGAGGGGAGGGGGGGSKSDPVNDTLPTHLVVRDSTAMARQHQA